MSTDSLMGYESNDKLNIVASEKVIRKTCSLCPVCLKRISAELVKQEATGAVFLVKECAEHGVFKVPVWKGKSDLEDWISREDPLNEAEKASCNGDCRACSSVHGQDTCCVILEVTDRCDLRCSYCFARGGENDREPSYDELCSAIDIIADKGRQPLVQFSGGEPTLRDDLPDLVKYAKDAGCSYTQVNTNGIRIASDEDYVRRLAEAGLDIAFLQFDGTSDEIYRQLRGTDLLDTKLRAIANCDRYNIGVTLVPTVVRGINDEALGNIVRLAADLFPAVRSVHFQPVTYLGRYPGDSYNDHYTLDELMADLCEQTGIPEKALLPSRCDHAMCEFHSTFLVNSNRQLMPMTDRSYDTRRDRTSASRNREYVAEHWSRPAAKASADYSDLYARGEELPFVTNEREELDLDEFARRMKTHTLKISAMAFQDAMNIDLERLYRCSLHVYEDGKLLPFCAKYLTPSKKTGMVNE